MTIETIQPESFKVYTIDSHPEPELCFEWVRNNWYDLTEHYMSEAIDSVKALADHIGISVDYSISAWCDRGEHVTFNTDNFTCDDKGCATGLASDFMSDDMLKGECPFTGCYYDEVLLDAFRNVGDDAKIDDVLMEAGENIISAIHKETEYTYSDKGLREMMEANGYKFTETGEFYE